jgi:hypothetical protein
MILPMADIVGLLQEGVGNLLRHAGLELMHLVMDEEVKSLAGERHQQHEQRRAHRWGKEDGYCVVDGQKVPIKRTRLRSGDNREQRLGTMSRGLRWPSSVATASGFVASPHSTRCAPRIHRSLRRVTAVSGSGVSRLPSPRLQPPTVYRSRRDRIR